MPILQLADVTKEFHTE